ncbi:hypothetical protein WKW80_35385 [Variovorax humicola]|uniref:Uncharacterized protein n=1 Tax=Variovorax humicola TaxID=1769758 RepID=A0ABU8WCK6_9BURK
MFPRSAFAIACLALASLQVHAEISKEELEALQRERDAAVAKKEITEAEAAQAKARIGTISTELPKGTGEASGLVVEPKILAYNAVDVLAVHVVAEVEKALRTPRTRQVRNADGTLGNPVLLRQAVVMFSDKDLYAINQARALRMVMTTLSQEVAVFKIPQLASDNPGCAAVAAAGAAGLPVLGAIDVGLQLVSLFKTDKKLQGADVTVDDVAFANAVMGQLLAKKIDAARPESFIASAIAAEGFDAIAASPTLATMQTLADKSSNLDIQLTRISDKRDEIKAKATAKPTPQCANAHRRDLIILDNLEIKGKALKVRADKVMTAASTVNEVGASLIQTMALADAFATRFSDAYVLQAKSIAAGGTINTKKNIFTTSFYASGGAIATYQLLDGSSGLPVAAGNVSFYGGNVNLNDLKGSAVPPQP